MSVKEIFILTTAFTHHRLWMCLNVFKSNRDNSHTKIHNHGRKTAVDFIMGVLHYALLSFTFNLDI